MCSMSMIFFYTRFAETTKTCKCTRKSDERSKPATKKPQTKTHGNQVQKNIRQMNIIDAMKRVPPQPKHRVQDTRNGHVIVLNEAGLEPMYVSKKVRKR